VGTAKAPAVTSEAAAHVTFTTQGANQLTATADREGPGEDSTEPQRPDSLVWVPQGREAAARRHVRRIDSSGAQPALCAG
jgi:hypothetical protein